MIWLQVITALFAVALAWLNKWPVKVFRDFLPKGHESEKPFHRANATVKVMWAVMLTWQSLGKHLAISWIHLVVFIIHLFIQWLVFDIALAVSTKGWNEWHYLGNTATLDKLVINGKIKAAVVAALILILNLWVL